MEAAAIIEAEARELIRRRGLDARADQLEPLIREVVTDYDQRSAGGAVPVVRDAETVVAEVAARIGGFGPLQEFLDDPEVEEIWVNSPLASVGGEIDLATPQGRLTARIKGSVARHEAEQMGRRIARKAEQTAREGLSTAGPTPFGYERRMVPREGGSLRMLAPYEPEARWIRDAYARLLAGDTLRQISLDMDAAGVKGRRGNRIVGSVLGNMLRRPVYAGIRVYKGERLGAGEWEPLVDVDTFDRAQAILDAPGRFHTRGTAPRYLLSGIALCGRCGREVAPEGARESEACPGVHACPDCTRLTRLMEPVDTVVSAVIVARLESLNLDLAETDPGDYQAAVAARDALTARMDTAADEYAEGRINARQLARITERLEG
jgi:site-specific DNA recombinase